VLRARGPCPFPSSYRPRACPNARGPPAPRGGAREGNSRHLKWLGPGGFHARTSARLISRPGQGPLGLPCGSPQAALPALVVARDPAARSRDFQLHRHPARARGRELQTGHWRPQGPHIRPQSLGGRELPRGRSPLVAAQHGRRLNCKEAAAADFFSGSPEGSLKPPT
jgi:hypothetical protein